MEYVVFQEVVLALLRDCSSRMLTLLRVHLHCLSYCDVFRFYGVLYQCIIRMDNGKIMSARTLLHILCSDCG